MASKPKKPNLALEIEPTVMGKLHWRKGAIGIWCPRYCALVFGVLHISKTKLDVDDASTFNDAETYLIDEDTVVMFDEREGGEKKKFSIKSENFGLFSFKGLSAEVQVWVFCLRMWEKDCTSRLSQSKKKNEGLSLDHFRVIKLLGRGSFGDVSLVERMDTGGRFALKAVSKRLLRKHNIVEQAAMERNILATIKECPFIVKLKFAFQTKETIYIGMECAEGGELLELIQSVSVVPGDDIVVFVAEIVLALEYLHDKGIVYRDLKPENVMLDRNGHVKLTDFGLAKTIDDMTQTFCGTAEFLAPEIIKREAYDFKVDCWALGVLTFIMIYGYPPFTGEQDELFSEILYKDPEFEAHGLSRAKDLVRALLNKDPAKRPTIKELKQRPFFQDLDWDKVMAKGYQPTIFKRMERDPSVEPDDDLGPLRGEYKEGGEPSTITGFSYDPVVDADLRGSDPESLHFKFNKD